MSRPQVVSSAQRSVPEATALAVRIVVPVVFFAWLAWVLVVASPETGILMAVVAVPMAIVGVVQRRRVTRRQRIVQAWADEHGWDYDRASGAVPRSGRDVLRTVLDGVPVASYTTTTASDMVSEAAAIPRHAVSAMVPADLPTLLVLPEALTRRPGAAPLSPDIQFESAAFNARWRVHCADATFAHAFVHPRVMERLMRPDAAGLSVFVEGRDVVVHAPGPTALDAVEARAALAADLARRVPPYLVAQYPPPTERVRRRAPEHSRTAAALALALIASYVGGLVALGRAGAPGAALALGAFSVVLAGVIVLLGVDPRRRRERAMRRARARGERPTPRADS